jgi:hypothetical protein
VRIRHAILAATAAVGLLASCPCLPADAAAKHYANCTAIHHDYPHGVGKKGAKDHTSGRPVTNFKVSDALYQANAGSDRDKDGIACEKA